MGSEMCIRDRSEGRSVALTSDAGTPAVADPGFVLVREAVAAGVPISAAPGPVAAVTALILSGLPTDRFLFAGFLPVKQGARRTAIADLARANATLILYESPRRCAATLADLAKVFGPDGPAVLCRELTKKFEDIRRGTLSDLIAGVEGRPPKGEVVLIVGRQEAAEPVDLDTALTDALARLSMKDAVAEVAGTLSLPRREVYQAALKLGKPG